MLCTYVVKTLTSNHTMHLRSQDLPDPILKPEVI